MVIVCPECSTKFRVNPERISDHGTKVRCARCKHVFMAQKPIEATPAAEPVENLEAPAPEDTPNFFSPAAENTAVVEERFAQIEDDLSAPVAESDFNYDQFRNLDQAPQDEDDFSFSGAFAAEGSSVDSNPENDDFTFGSGPDESMNQGSAMLAASEPSASAVPGVGEDDEEGGVFSTGLEEEPVFPDEPITPSHAAKKSPLESLIQVVLLLILGLVILCSAIYYINGPEQFEQMIQQLFGQTDGQQVKTGVIALNNLEGKFINNQEVGELFVIRGEAINRYQEPRASIQVKGVIFDHNGKSLLQKTIFCGNPISDQELESLPFSKIEELMSNQFGKSLSNMNVNTEQAIPFIIVFRDLPKSLAEFSVNIASSKPATQ